MSTESTPSDVTLLEGQKQYYRERAPEYDDWWYRRGRYDLGNEHTAVWDFDKDVLKQRLESFLPARSLLELAAGTGTWTEILAMGTEQLTVVDSSAEVLDINRAKIAALSTPASVEFVEADIFQLDLGRTFEAIFFSFWLSHVPDDRFEEFWAMVDRHLVPGGRVCIVDSAHPISVHDAQGDGANDVHVVSSGTSVNDLMTGTATRTLADGREFEIVKRYWHPTELDNRLYELGWAVDVAKTSRFFLHALVTKR
ncbi:MAG: ubiquinone/menaquinone biosynthesis C-methylase UbiE [Verrucomicrobiales bacterium]|jgi:ubiquinone/menaquinone biosynthesis C-methylase UbiE